MSTPLDHSLPGPSVHGILQARILEWLLFLPAGDLPDSGIEPESPASPAFTGIFSTTEPLRRPYILVCFTYIYIYIHIYIHTHTHIYKVKSLSHVRLFATPWTVAYQVPPSMGFSRQEYWSGLPFPSLDLPDPGIEPRSPAL